jgi:alpha-glucoside transport system permease protein
MIRTKKGTPWIYIAPAALLLGFLLIYPTIQTLVLSFFGANSETFVGLSNYEYAFTDGKMLVSFRNMALWVVFFTFFTVTIGLVMAVLLDRVPYESLAKSILFMPMAISMVGASVIWKFVYAWKPAGSQQIGLLNKVVELFGGTPQPWLTIQPFNTFFIIFVGVWIWTGFCMVVISGAYKNIPTQFLESARVEGATEWQIFWKIILPQLRSTIAVVSTTMIVFVLKIFDFVYVMTNGNFSTEVIANRMYKEMFKFQHFGRASTLAVILLLLTLPIMIANVKRFQKQREER